MSGAGVYGKVSTQPDFLRAGAGSFSQAGLDRWFQDGMELLRTEGTSLPATPTAFLLAPPESAVAFVGVFAPSADAAGRSFPLVVFSEVDAGRASGHAAVGAGRGGAVPERRRHADHRRGQRRRPDAGRAGPGVEARFPRGGAATKRGGTSRARPCWTRWAVHRRRWRTRCGRCRWRPTARAAGGAAAGVTVDAPAPTADAVGLWLEIIRRRLGPRTLPSLIWTEGLEGRLLITIGPLAPAALAYLANPRHRSSKLWPLRTVAAAATDEALRALTPEQRRLVENPGATLGDLAAAFAT